jgi:DNA-directed RNA polymerase specialized sigma24 family protein
MFDIGTDPEAFEAFYRRHVRMVTGFVARWLLDPHLVDDLTTEVFLAAMAGLPDGLRALLELVDVDGLPVVEAAGILKIRPAPSTRVPSPRSRAMAAPMGASASSSCPDG